MKRKVVLVKTTYASGGARLYQLAYIIYARAISHQKWIIRDFFKDYEL